MESNNELDALDADRAALAARIRTPWWLAAGFGLIAASFVVSPAFEGDRGGVIIGSIVIAIALIAAYSKSTGVKLAASGPTGWLLLVCGLIAVLGLFSVALALASLTLNGWIAVPTAFALVVGGGLTLLFTAEARKKMRRVR